MQHTILFFLLILGWCRETTPIKVACVGDSITYGAGMVNREKNAYPHQLQEMLGPRFEVANFGINGRTALRNGDLPYRETEAYQRALRYRPDLVFLLLGTNDSKSQNRQHLADFAEDYRELIRSFQSLDSQPRIILLLPPPSFLEDSTRIWDPVIRQKIKPLIQQIAYEEDLEVIDLYPLLVEQPDLLPDKVHPSSLGASILARRLYEVVTAERELTFELPANLSPAASGGDFNFHGFRGTEFLINDRNSKIVRPKWTADGRPWIWRARFWGHEPQTDIALLERGFHLVYTDVGGLFGSPVAVEIWNQFYREITKSGLAPKVVLEGMSRGGLIVYNWALANPEKVAGIYADAPVLAIKSWPGGKGQGKGSPSAWEECRQSYDFAGEAEALAFAGNPVDQAQALAALGIPLIHVSGLADEVVPYAENTGLLAERIRRAGGTIQLINKENVGHHPHSLRDPTPIVDFLLDAVGQRPNLAQIPQPAAEYRSAAGWPEACDWYCNYEDINRILDSLSQVDIIMLGNSITQGTGGRRRSVTYKPGLEAFTNAFAGKTWVNAGISGDRTEHILWRLQNGSYRQANPRIIVLTIGVNNFRLNTAEQIAAGILAIDAYLTAHFPETRLIVSGPLPTGWEAESDQRKKYDAVHRILAAQLPADHYFPIGAEWLLPSGNLNPAFCSKDGIHLVGEGYTAWARELRRIID